MSIALMTMARKTALPTNEKFVLMALADWADDNGVGEVSAYDLAEYISCSEDVACNLLRKLEASGWVAVCILDDGFSYCLNANRLGRTSGDRLEKRTSYEEWVAREEQAYADLDRLAAELANAVRPIAHFGDGNCGFVIREVLAALSAAGLYQDPRLSPAPPPKKAVIAQRLRVQVFERDAYRCVHCGTHKDLSVDHIKPESKGGTLDFDNLQTLCRSCNSKKGAK